MMRRTLILGTLIFAAIGAGVSTLDAQLSSAQDNYDSESTSASETMGYCCYPYGQDCSNDQVSKTDCKTQGGGFMADQTACSAICNFFPTCGNGRKTGNEECDCGSGQTDTDDALCQSLGYMDENEDGIWDNGETGSACSTECKQNLAYVSCDPDFPSRELVWHTTEGEAMTYEVKLEEADYKPLEWEGSDYQFSVACAEFVFFCNDPSEEPTKKPMKKTEVDRIASENSMSPSEATTEPLYDDEGKVQKYEDVCKETTYTIVTVDESIPAGEPGHCTTVDDATAEDTDDDGVIDGLWSDDLDDKISVIYTDEATCESVESGDDALFDDDDDQ